MKTNRILESGMPVRSLFYYKDNKRLIYGFDDSHINLIDTDKMRVYHSLVWYDHYIHNICYDNGVNFLAFVDGNVKI